MSKTPQAPPLARGVFGRPERIWRYDQADVTYQHGEWTYR